MYRLLLFLFALGVGTFAVPMVGDNVDLDVTSYIMDHTKIIDGDVTIRQKMIFKLLNHITQRTGYKDIEDISRDYKLEDNLEKYFKVEVVKDFLRMYKVGMLPKGEIFCVRCDKQMSEAIRVFHLLYFAKDFDTFIRTSCWLRERINEGMFVYALTVAVLHREDCRGIVLPAPYEIYPYYFIDSDVIQKAQMLKMKKGKLDQKMLDYYNIRVQDKNVYVIGAFDKYRRIAMNHEDRLNYFTEDVDLNTYYYYFHVDYPLWMGDDIFGVNKDRRGELYYYINQQLLARHKLERLSHRMCDVKMFSLWQHVKNGVWPNLRHHNGWDIPVRYNDQKIMRDENIHIVRLVNDYERRIRDAIFNGYIVTHDGTRMDLKKPEDIEILGRLIHGNLDKTDVRYYRYLEMLWKTLFGVDYQMNEKYRVVTTLLDHYETCLRDPVFWQLQKRIIDNFIVFKKLLPSYTRDDLNFPGVQLEMITTDKLVTYYDTTDIDITNSVLLNDEEIKKMKSDMTILARKTRLNHKPFTMTLEVTSDKAVDAVIRIFIGPKKDCMNRVLDINDRRLDFVEIDTFLYNMKTGKNVIIRRSHEMHNIIRERTFTRTLFDRTTTDVSRWYDIMNINKVRIGFPNHLLLPRGRKGGMLMTLYAIVTPVRVGRTMSDIKMDVVKEKRWCRSSICFDSMPLGFPLDRNVDKTYFYTQNMKFADVVIFHKEMDEINDVKTVTNETPSMIKTYNMDINSEYHYHDVHDDRDIDHLMTRVVTDNDRYQY